ncbi:MAG: hypothetical protein EKK42_16860 [Pseudonocardiaceae bacterium]|nr:MAG: hypothetical protein EKK42_16860 [Pseudonocardiaceae bacterium]
MDDPRAWLALAGQRFRDGLVVEAWEACRSAADAARDTGDIALLADAATTLRDLDWTPVRGQVHLLCVEVLARPDGLDPVRRARVEAQLAATRSPWEPVSTPGTPDGDPQARFLALQAEHADRLGPDGVARRLAIGGEAVGLGRAAGQPEYEAWGRFVRIAAWGVLGRRVEIDGEVPALAEVVERMGEPRWRARLGMVRACLQLLDGRFADSAATAADAAALGAAPHLQVVLASHAALLTGEGLPEVEARVRTMLDGAPFFARGWHASVLGAMGREAEAEPLWRAVAPHVGDMPRATPEWLVATSGHARLCVLFDDVATAAGVYAMLEPFAELLVGGPADTPLCGPVALDLGRLAWLLGDRARARAHLADALARAEAVHDPPHTGWAHLELARTADRPGGAEARAHLDAASALAARLGMAPLVAACAALATVASRGPLSPRETEVATLVADGLTNKGIAERLHLSERTVENHVSSIMRRTGLTSRAGVAAWVVGRPA